MNNTKTVACIVLNNFLNDSRVRREAASLQNNGYDVTVVALHEEPLPEYEKVDNFNVHRIRLKTRSWPRYKPVQLIKYFEFIWKAVRLYKKADILHCNDLNSLPIGVIIKKFFNINSKIVYDAHEYETEKKELAGLQKTVNRRLESLLINHADQVMTVSDSIANEYVRLYGISKPHIVLNCPVYFEQAKSDLFRKNLGIRADQAIFLYQGGLSTGRGIELLLEAFSDLDSDKNVLVGMGYGSLQGLIQEKAALQNTIFFHPAVSPDVLLNYTISADFGILFYEDTCLNHRYCSPNKMFEYLMAGLPVIVSNLFEMKRLVEKEGVGIVAHENTVQGFRKAVEASLNQDYAAIQKNVFAARKKYCWEAQEKVLKRMINSLTGRGTNEK